MDKESKQNSRQQLFEGLLSTDNALGYMFIQRCCSCFKGTPLPSTARRGTTCPPSPHPSLPLNQTPLSSGSPQFGDAPKRLLAQSFLALLNIKHSCFPPPPPRRPRASLHILWQRSKAQVHRGNNTTTSSFLIQGHFGVFLWVRMLLIQSRNFTGNLPPVSHHLTFLKSLPLRQDFPNFAKKQLGGRGVSRPGLSQA